MLVYPRDPLGYHNMTFSQNKTHQALSPQSLNSAPWWWEHLLGWCCDPSCPAQLFPKTPNPQCLLYLQWIKPTGKSTRCDILNIGNWKPRFFFISLHSFVGRHNSARIQMAGTHVSIISKRKSWMFHQVESSRIHNYGTYIWKQTTILKLDQCSAPNLEFWMSLLSIFYSFSLYLKDFEVFQNMDAVSVLEHPNDILYPHLSLLPPFQGKITSFCRRRLRHTAAQLLLTLVVPPGANHGTCNTWLWV